MGVGMVESADDDEEERHAGAQAQPSLGAEDVDRPPVDVLHDEAEAPVVGDSAVHEPRDVGVGERREHPPLEREPLLDLSAAEAVVEDLHRDALLASSRRPRGEPDGPHAAATDLADQSVRSDAPAGERAHVGGGHLEQARDVREERSLHERRDPLATPD